MIDSCTEGPQRHQGKDDIHKNIYAKKELLIFLEKLRCFSRSKLRCKESKKKSLKISSLWQSQTNRDEGSKACRNRTNIGKSRLEHDSVLLDLRF